MCWISVLVNLRERSLKKWAMIIVMRFDPKSKKIVGFTILNFEKRFENLNKSETLPITATFAQIDRAIEAEG